MQLAANQTLVRNRVRLGTGLHLSALAVFGIGLWISISSGPELTTEITVLSYGSILVGMVLYTFGQQQLRRWGPRSRQEQLIGHAIRGLDDRYKLYAFISSSLPDYVLVGPMGVQVLVARNEGGLIQCENDHWRRPGRRMITSIFGPPMGNPSAEAQNQLRKVRTILDRDTLGDVPASALVVFTNPRAQLKLDKCSVTVTKAKELKDVVRRAAGKGQRVALSAARVREVQAVFDRTMEAALGWR